MAEVDSACNGRCAHCRTQPESEEGFATTFVGGLFDQGDELPVLVVTTVERVLPGDIYWGCAWDSSNTTRKGWVLHSEGEQVQHGAVPHEFEVEGIRHCWWRIGGYQFKRRDDLVLVQKR